MTERRAFLIPAYNAGDLLGSVLDELWTECRQAGLDGVPIIVVDDGSTDHAFADPRVAQATITLVRHGKNRGKGAALVSGFETALARGIETVVTLDADGQHPAKEAIRLLLDPAPKGSLVLGVRDLAAAGAPRKNRLSNSFSNVVLSLFGGEKLQDTQCGLRRYPIKETMQLGACHPRYAFESDVVLRAARRGLPIVQILTSVRYPEGERRVSHFDSVRDPTAIVIQVVRTTLQVPHARPLRRWLERAITLTPLAVGVWYFLS